MRPLRRVRCRAAAALGAVVGAVLLTGCGNGGGLRSAGPTPVAVGPARLWPELPPASAAPYDYGEGETARIPGIKVPDGDVHRLDPVAVVRAGLRARPNRSSGTADLPADTVRKINACRTEPAACPVLRPYFRDLTGDGRDDLVLGIRLADHQLSVRVYMPEAGGLTRILSTSDAVISVELAGRDLIMRVPSAITGYEYRTAWSWDARQRAMLPTQDEIQRIPPSRAPHALPPAVRPTTTPTGPTATPSAGVSAERR
ncbi:lipoprotein [Streptomyces pulveraceus]|uniref:Lipoprotein n=1 Tax=Streptomyces pulveraceus TaxID=68258 RepID=A0ABW1GIK5_9ACTN